MTLHKVEGTLPQSDNTAVKTMARPTGEGNLSPARRGPGVGREQHTDRTVDEAACAAPAPAAA